MLPPGFFLLKSSQIPMVSDLDVVEVSSLHPVLDKDMTGFGPWEKSQLVDGVGGLSEGCGEIQTPLVVVRCCGSTMELARLLIERELIGHWGAVVSIEQVTGRGQLRRPWVSPPGNLHISIVLPTAFSTGPWSESLDTLRPLVAGYVSSVVLGELGAQLKIKWPNDLLQNNQKVGGMLIEERDGVVILGIGLNLVDCPTESQMREDHSVPAGVLQTNQSNPGPLALGGILVNRGKSVYENVLDEFPPSRFVKMLEDHLAWFGQDIEIREGGGEPYKAMIKGLSPEGGLVVRSRGKESVLFSGSLFPL